VHHEVLVLSGRYEEISSAFEVVMIAATNLDSPEAVSEITNSFSSLLWARKMFGLIGFSGLGRAIPSASLPVA